MVKGFPVHKKLSEVSPDNPHCLEYVQAVTLHWQMLTKQWQVAGVNQLAIEKNKREGGDGGKVDAMRWVILNRIIYNERAMELIEEYVPARTGEKGASALGLAINACQRNGITSFHDAGATREDIDLFHQFKKDGKLGVRLYAMVTGRDSDLVYEWLRKGPEIDSTTCSQFAP